MGVRPKSPKHSRVGEIAHRTYILGRTPRQRIQFHIGGYRIRIHGRISHIRGSPMRRRPERQDFAPTGLESVAQRHGVGIQEIQLHGIGNIPARSDVQGGGGRRHTRLRQQQGALLPVPLPIGDAANGEIPTRGENPVERLRPAARPKGVLPFQVIECHNGTARRVIWIHVKDNPFRTVIESVQVAWLIRLSASDRHTEK